MTLPLKTIMTLCLLMPGVVISAPEVRAQGCIWIQDGDQCLPPEVLHPSMNDPVAPGRPQSLPSPSSAPHPSWVYAPSDTVSDSASHITAIFFSPGGYITRVTSNDEERALSEGRYACLFHDSLRRECTLLDVVIDGSVSYAYPIRGDMSYAFHRDARRSSQLAQDQCKRFNHSAGCKALMPPVGSVPNEDPKLRAGEFTPLSPEGTAAVEKVLAERAEHGTGADRLGP